MYYTDGLTKLTFVTLDCFVFLGGSHCVHYFRKLHSRSRVPLKACRDLLTSKCLGTQPVIHSPPSWINSVQGFALSVYHLSPVCTQTFSLTKTYTHTHTHSFFHISISVFLKTLAADECPLKFAGKAFMGNFHLVPWRQSSPIAFGRDLGLMQNRTERISKKKWIFA